MKSTKNKIEITEIARLLQSVQNVALFSHTRPDGDTVGATVALSLALKQLGKNVALFCDEPMKNGLPHFEQTSAYSTEFYGNYDLFVAVDCGDLFRLGEFAGVYQDFAETLTVDHHGGEYFSKYNCVLNYASTCQIIYEIVQCLPVKIDGQLATYLYMGLCTDTGNFANSNTDKPSFLMAAELCELGADMQKVNRVFFRDIPFATARVQGYAAGRMREYFGGKLVIIFLTCDDLKKYGCDSSASEGMVQHAIGVETATAGVSLCEYAQNCFKVSMRSKNFNVRDICRTFGGGGHLVAAGCEIHGFLEDVIEQVVRAFSWSME
ncbi:MAG: bifunctional oligoribonuclease/PAP phosphatase NrnA [Corallococcus sp.]|nr:bifunctional oligoribonuclease/PAP phosphatase NrnA [Corallococcus sp.]MCM1359722.1 bifunctional oligoribonuclease/PAP phosphatase NrnA [Corallococcus sp.]MCM1395431.1 bifunctional oligoribonuclease/PAP phosphatase NrnA [Corallococcus sp.]